jgi:hypothetical protein
VKRVTRSMKAFALGYALALVACTEVGGEAGDPFSDPRAPAQRAAEPILPPADLPGEPRGRPPGDVFQPPYPDEDEADQQN